MKWLTLFTAILLATCAAYFSIVGLMTIFAGAAMSIMVMASVLEFAKLVSAAWLHYEWDRINNLVRVYFTTAVLILMFITSMGIFGYLSKAHIDQTILSGGGNDIKIENLERQIGRQQAIITDAETVLNQLDEAVATLIEYDRIRGPEGSIAVRESQKEERQSLNDTINNAYERIDGFQSELIPLQQTQLSLEAEVGPLKYIAELVYGEEHARDNFDSAVRAVIILLVVVFDPLAVMLLIVSTGAFKRDRKQIKPLINEDQIMRMDIDGDTTDGSSGSNVPEVPEHDSGEISGEENDNDKSFLGDSTGIDESVQRRWEHSEYNSEREADQPSNIDDIDWDRAPSKDETKKRKGLTTVMSRRPV